MKTIWGGSPITSEALFRYNNIYETSNKASECLSLVRQFLLSEVLLDDLFGKAIQETKFGTSLFKTFKNYKSISKSPFTT